MRPAWRSSSSFQTIGTTRVKVSKEYFAVKTPQTYLEIVSLGKIMNKSRINLRYFSNFCQVSDSVLCNWTGRIYIKVAV